MLVYFVIFLYNTLVYTNIFECKLSSYFIVLFEYLSKPSIVESLVVLQQNKTEIKLAESQLKVLQLSRRNFPSFSIFV